MIDTTYQDLSGQDLSGKDFSYMDLTGTNFIGSKLDGANFTGAILQYANLTDASVIGTIFDDSLAGFSLFKNVDLSTASFIDTKVKMSPIMHKHIKGANVSIEPVDEETISDIKDKLHGLTVVLDSFDDRKVSNHEMMAHGRKTGKYKEALAIHKEEALVDRMFAGEDFKFYIKDKSSGLTTEVTYYPPVASPSTPGSSDEPEGTFDTAPYTELFVI